MRLLLVFILAANFSFFTVANAQHSTNAFALTTSESSNTSFLNSNQTNDSDNAAMHTRLAVSQIQNRIAKVSYPESMTHQNIEGEVIVEISISKIGEIYNTKIVKSLSAEFDTLILETINKIEKINFTGANYQGGKRFRMPVAFSLR